ncbi:GntR family transcriptional regulator [Streptomyces sp. NPDC093085]|uniref:GntR family transcriptional regulator n=1 Tax=Streptomyces sp. NPDC093085 TaxID=3155068 RepID=UPI0034346AFA
MIEFHLDGGSGLSPYQQLVQQVRHALRLGLLAEGDRLPTVKEVAGRLAINPNTVLKAYRELEHDGLVAARQGVGTFVTRTLPGASPAALGPLRKDLRRWLTKARLTGLDDESIEALFLDTFRNAAGEGVA